MNERLRAAIAIRELTGQLVRAANAGWEKETIALLEAIETQSKLLRENLENSSTAVDSDKRQMQVCLDALRKLEEGEP